MDEERTDLLDSNVIWILILLKYIMIQRRRSLLSSLIEANMFFDFIGF